MLLEFEAPQSAISIGRQFGDENPQLLGQIMLSGARVTDVDVDKQRAVETRTALEQMMKGHPDLSQDTSFYVKPEDQAKLTPDEILIMRKYTEIKAAAQKFAKQKRQQIGIQ